MSRCFPYPPPGYDKKNYNDDEALIESIKSERKKDKEKRKEKKREKKERKEKEKKEKTRENGETENKVNSHKKKRRHKDDGSNIHQKDTDHPKKIENEIEQLEKSSLTEEHGQPGSVQNVSDSSDSTQNSSKRKKHTPASTDGGIHNLGSTFRIRLPLPLLKHKALEVPHIIKEQPSSTSRRTVILAPKHTDVAPRSSTEVLCSTSGRLDIPARDKAEPASARTSSLGSGSLDIDTQYRDLFENWVPLPVQNECSDFDDQEWLFDTRQQPSRRHEAKKIKASDYASVLGSSSLWPAAYYLSEADMYALPYTVPF